MIQRNRNYIERKIKFLEHRLFILRERINKDGGTEALQDALNNNREMLVDYQAMRQV